MIFLQKVRIQGTSREINCSFLIRNETLIDEFRLVVLGLRIFYLSVSVCLILHLLSRANCLNTCGESNDIMN